MLTLLAILVGSLFNIGIFFVLLHLLFKKKLSLEIKILIAFLFSVSLSYLFGKVLIINVAGHGISAVLLYLLLKSGLLKLEKSNNANKEKEIKNKLERNTEQRGRLK